MPKCVRCEEKFDEYDARVEFELDWETSGYHVSYDNVKECLCGKCALEGFVNQDGSYMEQCECCGKEFDPIGEREEFEYELDEVNADDMYEFGILCAQCAAKKWKEIIREEKERYGTDSGEYDDEDDHDGLSVEEAALIWLSNGKDEEYTFGYTEEELEDAL